MKGDLDIILIIYSSTCDTFLLGHPIIFRILIHILRGYIFGVIS